MKRRHAVAVGLWRIDRAYASFNARDVDAALAAMYPDVDWPNALDGGRVRGHDELRRYWLRQFELFDPRVEPQTVSEAQGGRLVVDVRQIVRDRKETLITDELVQHVYVIRDGLIARMDIGGISPGDREGRAKSD